MLQWWDDGRDTVYTGPVWGQNLSLSLSSSMTLSRLAGWELLSPGQSDRVWHPLYFLQEQGGQTAVLNQGIVSLLYRNRAFGGKENFKNKTYLKMHFPSPNLTMS